MRASFRVETAAPAEVDLRAIYNFIARDSTREAAKWLRGALTTIRSLRTLPERYERVPEDELLTFDCRHVPYGNYRIVYRVEDRRVRVLRVIHAARLLTPEMLRE
jgi:plasmid stabilization system protein ParE